MTIETPTGEEMDKDLNKSEEMADGEEIMYVDPATGTVHNFRSSAEKMEWIEGKNDPSNK